MRAQGLRGKEVRSDDLRPHFRSVRFSSFVVTYLVMGLSEVVFFDFPVEAHLNYTQQAGCFCLVPCGLIRGFKNCGRAALDSWSANEVTRQMIECDSEDIVVNRA